MVTVNRVERFRSYGICIHDSEVLHINGIVAVDKTNRECHRVDGTARYTGSRYISENLQDLARQYGAARDRQGTQGRDWRGRCAIGAAGSKDKEDERKRQKYVMPWCHGNTTLPTCSKNTESGD